MNIFLKAPKGAKFEYILLGATAGYILGGGKGNLGVQGAEPVSAKIVKEACTERVFPC